MKTTLIIIGAILLAALIGAGSFWGGMAYQTRQVNQVRTNFENARGPGGGGQFPTDGSGFSGGMIPGGVPQGLTRGGGTTGQVKAIDGNIMTLSTAQDVTTVNLSESTQIVKTVTGTIADLQPGTRVMVTGEADDDGAITAVQVTILNNMPTGSAYPSPAEGTP